ncbi:MAG: hypothetical protein JSR61_00975 [Proteobacteria bacterium]|nr:hypothetical protein [Pseudomonadota bacterium]
MRKTLIFGALAALIGLGTVAQASNTERVAAASGAPQAGHARADHRGDRHQARYAEHKHKRDNTDLRDYDGDGRRDSHQRYDHD